MLKLKKFYQQVCFLIKSFCTFKFMGQKYHYFLHTYNVAWNNERSVEVAIIWSILKKYQNKNVLEVGNVLSHYFPIHHEVIDKYEKAKGVINQDIATFKPKKKYDLIISISTLEHVGWDEKPKNPKKILFSFNNLKKMLNNEGKMVITLPVGYNFYLDKLIQQRKINFNQQYYFKRISKSNKWQETNCNAVFKSKYDFPFPFANGLIIGLI